MDTLSNNGLTSIIIGNNMTSIEDYAFYNHIGLMSIAIGNSVTSIENMLSVSARILYLFLLVIM